MNTKVDASAISRDLNLLKTRMDNIEDTQNELETENTELRNQLKDLELKNDKLEAQQRRENLLFFGIPETPVKHGLKRKRN